MKTNTLDKHQAQALNAQIYIQEYLHNDLNAAEIAAKLNCSPFHFQRLFSQSTGMPFKKYMNDLRLQRAATALTATTLPITQIILTSGFKTREAFNYAFTRQYKKTPHEFRQASYHKISLLNQTGYIAKRNLNFEFTQASNCFAKALGFKNRDELIGKTFLDSKIDMAPGHAIPNYHDQLTVDSKNPLFTCGQIRLDNGNSAYLLTTRQPEFDENGAVIGIYQHSVMTNSSLLQALINTLARFPKEPLYGLKYHSYIIANQFGNFSKLETQYLFYLLRDLHPKKLSTLFNLSHYNSEELYKNLLQKTNSENIDELQDHAKKHGYLHIIPRSMIDYKTVAALIS